VSDPTAAAQPFKAACVQLNAAPEVAPNLAAAAEFIREARAAGADLIMTPETSDLLEPDRESLLAKLRPESDHAGIAAYGALAGELGCWLLAGSFLIDRRPAAGAEAKPANRSYLFDPQGRIAARYDKIHMFDVEIPDGQSYRESRRFEAGGQAVMADLPWGRLGLTICYDLRFPQLYRDLAQAGADFLTVPSAFTRFTGRAHWHLLLRARAVETGCFVFAPAQCGEHARGRSTYGHSLIVAPWGEILAEAGEEPGFILAEIDPQLVAKARRAVPSLSGTRPYGAPQVAP
jgi:predicted amidohydrolase